MSVKVAKEGNRREGEMDNEEKEQCVLDIVTWFSKKANIENNKMDPSDTQRIERQYDLKLPRIFSLLLEKQNGGIWFNEYECLSSEVILKLSSSCNWEFGVPFAFDMNGTYLILDTNAKDGVFEYSLEDGRGKQVCSSFPNFLEEYRNKLLSGNVEYIEDIGVIERARK